MRVLGPEASGQEGVAEVTAALEEIAGVGGTVLVTGLPHWVIAAV